MFKYTKFITKNTLSRSLIWQQNTIRQSSTSDSQSKLVQLKKTIKEYGSTVVVFHVAISLLSLGTSYLLISSGINLHELFMKYDWFRNNEIVRTNIASGTGTFLLAYAVHKVFAPARITITVSVAPFIVRYLRSKHIFKK